MPPSLAEKPELQEDLITYWNAFFTLVWSRPIGMAIGYIPLSEIIQYGIVLGYNTDMEYLERFIYLIQSMDEVYVELQSQGKR